MIVQKNTVVQYYFYGVKKYLVKGERAFLLAKHLFL